MPQFVKFLENNVYEFLNSKKEEFKFWYIWRNVTQGNLAWDDEMMVTRQLFTGAAENVNQEML